MYSWKNRTSYGMLAGNLSRLDVFCCELALGTAFMMLQHLPHATATTQPETKTQAFVMLSAMNVTISLR